MPAAPCCSSCCWWWRSPACWPPACRWRYSPRPSRSPPPSRSTSSCTARCTTASSPAWRSPRKAISDEARQRAEAANISKSRFLAQMSHELRTPLNAILGFSEVMKTEVFGEHAVPAYKEYSADIHNSGVHLLGLINEILDLSRIEAGRYELNEESVSLAAIVEDCHHLLKLRATNRGITIHEMFEM